MSDTIDQARAEIHKSLILSDYCLRSIGFSLFKPKNRFEFWKQKAMFILCMACICYHVFGDIVYIFHLISDSARVEEVVILFHTFGFGALSISKLIVLWYKIDVLRNLLIELATIWPMPPLEEENQAIKDKSLSALTLAHRCYLAASFMSVLFFCTTPIAIYFYQQYWMQEDTTLGFVWKTWYPFDKHKPIGHVVAYIFEVFIGQICVGIMVSSDLLFTGVTSHIGLLLRLLQRRLECIGNVHQSHEDQYEEIKENIKLHQRLIEYCNDINDAFSLSNLVNVFFSSVNICCVVFVVVLLEPVLEISNKMFLISALLQIGMICWYADDIFHASVKVGTEAYNSRWYVTNPKCRRALLFLITRTQKPIAFTAMKFTNMNLITYTAILTRSYSYFALLYTIYNEN